MPSTLFGDRIHRHLGPSQTYRMRDRCSRTGLHRKAPLRTRSGRLENREAAHCMVRRHPRCQPRRMYPWPLTRPGLTQIPSGWRLPEKAHSHESVDPSGEPVSFGRGTLRRRICHSAGQALTRIASTASSPLMMHQQKVP